MKPHVFRNVYVNSAWNGYVKKKFISSIFTAAAMIVLIYVVLVRSGEQPTMLGTMTVFGLMASFFVFMVWKKEKHIEDLKKAAQSRGWRSEDEFTEGSLRIKAPPSKFLTRQNVKLFGKIDRTEALIIDGDRGRGKHSRPWTVVMLQISLPEFTMSPEHFLGDIAKRFGYEDIDILGHEEFNTKHILRGPSKEAIVSLFSDSVITKLSKASFENFRLSSREGWLEVAWEGRLNSQNLETAISRAREIFSVFENKH